ncbi:MAG: hypothetical protein LC745_13195, partial [Planctomycetia bacterium]|nr:hypothetical protein [Planctomycetia bacterium]
LDDLLKKVEERESKPAEKPGAEKPAVKGEGDTGAKPSGDVATKDKDLDSLLEKLGTTEDKAAPEERGGPGAGRPEPRPPGKPDASKKKDPNQLTGKDEDLDLHLEEASGKRRKKKGQQGEEDGPLSQVIKEMREVEERLGKPDTGEETRKKQTEIVKKIETLIEQAKNSQGQSQGKKKSLAMAKGKQQPGQPKGDQSGTTGGNAPFTKPQKPTDRRSLAGGKELWGDLPPEVRQDLDNVMKEGFLPSREELIRRYYLSLSRKKSTRGE